MKYTHKKFARKFNADQSFIPQKTVGNPSKTMALEGFKAGLPLLIHTSSLQKHGAAVGPGLLFSKLAVGLLLEHQRLLGLKHHCDAARLLRFQEASRRTDAERCRTIPQEGRLQFTVLENITSICGRGVNISAEIQHPPHSRYLRFFRRNWACDECWTAQRGSSTDSGAFKEWEGVMARRFTGNFPSVLWNSMLSSYSHCHIQSDTAALDGQFPLLKCDY